jgi:hypothetical protein
MKTLERAERLVFPLAVLVLAGLYFRQVLGLPRPHINATLIKYAFYSMLILGFVVLLQELSELHVKRKGLEQSYWIKFILFLLATVAMLWGMDYLGFRIAAFLYLISAFYVLGERNYKNMLAWSLGITILMVSIFEFWVSLPLPKGLLNF